MSNPMVIVNKMSGKKRGEAFLKYLKKYHPGIPFYMPDDQEDFIHVLKKYGPIYETIIIAGGDGTINLALPYFIINPQKKLAVFPMGSGNGFAMETGFGANFDELVKDIGKGESVHIDVIKLDGRYSCNVGGIGFDGYIAGLFLHQKTRGFLKYVWLTLSAIRNFSPFKAKVIFQTEVIEGEFLSIVIANTRQFGNKAYIAPAANPSDGKMNFVFIQKMPWVKLLSFFIKLFTGQLHHHDFVQMVETGSNVKVQAAFSYAHTDGEPFFSQENLDIEILPKAIQIVKTRNNSNLNF